MKVIDRMVRGALLRMIWPPGVYSIPDMGRHCLRDAEAAGELLERVNACRRELCTCLVLTHAHYGERVERIVARSDSCPLHGGPR